MSTIGICPDCGNYYGGIGHWPFCPHGEVNPRPAALHSSDKVVVYENPQTGDVRIPGRADRPMHPKYAEAGFVRRELNTLSEIRTIEKKTGLAHQASQHDSIVSMDRDVGDTL